MWKWFKSNKGAYSSHKSLGSPFWIYIIPSIIYNFKYLEAYKFRNADALLRHALFMKHKKLSESYNMATICMIAAVIEGMFRTYLIINLPEYSKIKDPCKKFLINDFEWTRLKKAFEEVTGSCLKKSSLLNSNHFESEQIGFLFRFRNFIIHGNAPQIDLENVRLNHGFKKGETLILYNYICKHNLKPIRNLPENEDYHFVEYLFPDELVSHFYKLLKNLIDAPMGKELNRLFTGRLAD